MYYIDIFNGDADGILGLHQLRLQDPKKTDLITGVKRDTLLVKHALSFSNSTITIIDISYDANRHSLLQLLNQGNTVNYFDHHYAGKIIKSSQFNSYIDTSPHICSSILVDRYLGGKYRLWAVAAAFGDNLHPSAYKLAESLKLDQKSVQELRELGELINYNSYGETIDDLYFPPKNLFLSLQHFEDPFEFIDKSSELKQLHEGFQNDMSKAVEKKVFRQSSVGRIFYLPNASWSRRVSGVFSNMIAREAPEMAHALLVERFNGNFLVGVRAPITRPFGADKLCRKFSGGGRAAAAGINNLIKDRVADFIKAFEEQF